MASHSINSVQSGLFDSLAAVSYWQWALATVLGYWVTAILYRLVLSPLRKYPGPFFGRISVAWWLWHVSHKADMQWATLEQHKRHGTFVRVTHNEISVAHEDAVSALLTNPLEKGSWYKIFSIPDSRYVNQMAECIPERHAAMQRNISSGYALSSLIKAEPFLDDAIQLWEQQIDALYKAKKSIKIDQWFTFFTFDIVGELTFSKRFGFLEAGKDLGSSLAVNEMMLKYLSVMGHFHKYHDLLTINPLMDYLNLQPLKHVFETADKAIRYREDNEEHHNDMMELWKHTQRKHPDRVSQRDIHSTAIGTIAAGADTVSTQLQAFIYYLLHDPPRLARLREEIDTAAAAGKLSTPVQYSESQALPYFQACLKETLRFHPIFVSGYPRIVPKDGLTIAGQFFAPGTMLSVNPWVIHRLPSLFGPDADAFVPERWLDPKSKNLEKYMITFGAGYNQCPGRHAAQLQLNKLLATVVRDYDIELDHPERPWRFQKCFVARPYGWTCRMARRVTR